MAKAKKTAASKVRGKTKGSRGAAKTAAKTGAKVKAGPSKSVGKAAKKTTGAAMKNLGSVTETGPVLEYKLFVEDSVRNLEDQVNYYIGKGWSPVGGVVVQNGGHFMQSMVRREH